MPDIRILLVIAVAVIGFPLFAVLFFGHFYRREVRIKTLSSKSVEGVVVGYKRAQIVAAPIVEYRVDGQTYRNSLKYYWVVRATLPWKTNQAASDIDLMAQRITIYTNSTVSKGNLFQDGLNPEQLFYFNREDVDKVVYPGYSDEEEERFAEIYQRWLDENSETIKKGVTKSK